MVALKGIRLYFVIIGVFELLLSVVFVVCTKIVLQKYSDPGVDWYSLFYLYYAIPGVLCILSGVVTTPSAYVKASIGFHIISVVVSTIGAAVSSVFWQMYKDADACATTSEDCVCFKKSYDISCEDGEVSRVLLAVLTAANIVMIMMSFIGSVLACTNVCCDPVQSGNDHRSSRNTSHSEPTVISQISHYESRAIVCPSSIQTSIRLQNFKQPSPSKPEQTNQGKTEIHVHDVKNDVKNVHECKL